MLKLAWRNLSHQRTRMMISVGGVALAILLILVMSGIFAGSEEHAVLYIRNQPAPLWAMQVDVENMHMSSSILSPEIVERIQQIKGVAQAVGVLYGGAGVEIGDTDIASYVFGIAPNTPLGGPWKLAEGTANPGMNQVILDVELARRYNLKLGDTVRIMGFPLTIAGLSEETFGIATNITFVNKTAMALLMGVSPQAASYVLIVPEAGTDVEALASAIKSAVPEANVLTQDEFARSDQLLIRQMGADIIQMMNVVAYIIGLLVIAMTIYTATLERAREYGVLKAIGANVRQLLSIVFAQSFIAAGAGFLLGVVFAYGVASLVGRLSPEIFILIQPVQWLSEIPTLVLITGLAALLPIERILRVDPMVVFKA